MNSSCSFKCRLPLSTFMGVAKYYQIALTETTLVYGLLRYYKTKKKNPKVNNVRLYLCGHDDMVIRKVHISTALTYNVSIFHKANCTRPFRAVYEGFVIRIRLWSLGFYPQKQDLTLHGSMCNNHFNTTHFGLMSMRG